ncbi:conjugative transposon protein TraM [Arenibacter sp. 6A1]|uniref:conjugative transposon protein TraM n=1 Tax=Arenibacter sp. 6A1 TaxID=2720391 RepID=UPI001445FBC4|nr:conjugative transposon protein TraM [Arenibacter sp. 6A1]NKI27872.1 conjugative transposon protein TraM [Arenibacter sp. 6A1]
MNRNIEKFNLWLKRHKLFAFSAPIIVFLAAFFVMTSISSIHKELPPQGSEDGYNKSLPNHDQELDVSGPNDIYNKSRLDSLNQLRTLSKLKGIESNKKKNDSLEQILIELQNFSFSERDKDRQQNNPSSSSSLSPSTKATSIVSEAQKKLAYRNMLIQAREQRLARNQDYSAPYIEPSQKKIATTPLFNAVIYRDQFILPGNRVTLILREDIKLNGRRFPKNTFVYATANIQGARILLEVSNLANIPIALTAIDQEDGMIGLHNERAGELLQEFKADIQHQGIKELSATVGNATDIPLAQNLVRSFGNFFRKKKYKQRDKILLVNGDRVFLTPKKQE